MQELLEDPRQIAYEMAQQAQLQQSLAYDPTMMALRKRMPAASDPSVAKWELDNKELIDKLKHYLRGEEYDDQKKEWYSVEGSQPKMNEYGIHSFAIMLRSYTDKNLIMSNFKEQQIMDQMLKTMIEVNRDLFNNQDLYGLRVQNFGAVLNMVRQIVFASYLRSLNQGERIYRRMIQSWQETMLQRDQSPAPKKSAGFWSRLFGGGSR